MAVFGPPGGVGEDGRPVDVPAAPMGELTGDEDLGDDYIPHDGRVSRAGQHTGIERSCNGTGLELGSGELERWMELRLRLRLRSKRARRIVCRSGERHTIVEIGEGDLD